MIIEKRILRSKSQLTVTVKHGMEKDDKHRPNWPGASIHNVMTMSDIKVEKVSDKKELITGVTTPVFKVMTMSK